MKIEWESIYDQQHEDTGSTKLLVRCKVFGGWLVVNTTIVNGSVVEAMAFVPDANHQWGADIMDGVI